MSYNIAIYIYMYMYIYMTYIYMSYNTALSKRRSAPDAAVTELLKKSAPQRSLKLDKSQSRTKYTFCFRQN